MHYPETVRAAYYLSHISDEPLRRKAESALVSRQISGDAVPAYVQKLQEAKEQRHRSPSQKQEGEERQLPQSPTGNTPNAQDASTHYAAQCPLPSPTTTEPAPVSASAKDESRLERELSYLQGYAHRLKQRPRSTGERHLLEEIMKVIQQINEVDSLPTSLT